MIGARGGALCCLPAVAGAVEDDMPGVDRTVSNSGELAADVIDRLREIVPAVDSRVDEADEAVVFASVDVVDAATLGGVG